MARAGRPRASGWFDVEGPRARGDRLRLPEEKGTERTGKASGSAPGNTEMNKSFPAFVTGSPDFSDARSKEN